MYFYFYDRMVSFLFYSHSEYRDLWPILIQNLEKLPTGINTYICVNENSQNLEMLSSSFSRVFKYKDNQTYPQKVLEVLRQIQEEYIVFIHDNDLLVTFDCNAFSELMQIVQEKNIHRCMFGIVGNRLAEVVRPTFSIGSAKVQTPHFITPYDVGPSIWNLSAFQSALQTVENVQYRDIEWSHIQTYCNDHLNMYGFYSHPQYPSRYVIGRPFPSTFQFLHICGQGKLFESYLYMDQEKAFLDLVHKFPDLEKRGYLQNQHHIQTGNREY